MTEASAPDLPPLPSLQRMTELLFDAARSGRIDVIPALLRAGVDIEAVDARDFSPLVVASYNGQYAATALLLEQGALPDGAAPQVARNTALMGVAFKGHGDIARLLLDSGAQVDRRNAAGQTALMTASLFGQTAIVDLLLDQGADRTLRDAAGNDAAGLAEAQGNTAMVERLRSR